MKYYLTILYTIMFLILCQYALASDELRSDHQEFSTVQSRKIIGQLEAEGFTYTYEIAQRQLLEENNEHSYGIITMRDSNNNETIREEISGLNPSPGLCGKFPLLSRWPYKTPHSNKKHWLVTICASDVGHNVTLKIFHKDNKLRQVRSTELNFDNSNVIFGKRGFSKNYVAEIAYRTGTSFANQYCFKLYTLQIDQDLSGNQQFSFLPLFEQRVEKIYLRSYA